MHGVACSKAIHKSPLIHLFIQIKLVIINVIFWWVKEILPSNKLMILTDICHSISYALLSAICNLLSLKLIKICSGFFRSCFKVSRGKWGDFKMALHHSALQKNDVTALSLCYSMKKHLFSGITKTCMFNSFYVLISRIGGVFTAQLLCKV